MLIFHLRHHGHSKELSDLLLQLLHFNGNDLAVGREMLGWMVEMPPPSVQTEDGISHKDRRFLVVSLKSKLLIGCVCVCVEFLGM